MRIEELFEEGRQLARPCVFLTETGVGPVAAVWQPKPSPGEDYPDELCWLTVDLQRVPDLPDLPGDQRFLRVFTDGSDGGRVEFASELPVSGGVPLYAQAAAPLPPIDAVFARGSARVQAWLAENDWTPDERYNSNFRDHALVDEYERVWQTECPAFQDTDVYAVLGGWHLPGADDDWHDLIDTPLVVWTLRDAEPWVEVFYAGGHGEDGFRTVQRIT